ncbi:DUF58 domain-containing protein [Microbacterium sp.]|uniref:DUF58 domain-containing protein n=1 Tax=Microbacterium sp. TaxID=51671 RepID=UPI0025ED2BB1|nr:DUF58 domain-containing protein [Microbacterium sp.]
MMSPSPVTTRAEARAARAADPSAVAVPRAADVRGSGTGERADAGVSAPAATPVAATSAREPSWRESAVPVAAYALRRVAGVLSVARPVTWVLIATVIVCALAGSMLGWAELVVAAVVITTALAVCALFLIGRTTYDVALDLTRTRVVVGERAVGALTLTNGGDRAILPSRVVLPVGSGRGTFDVPRLSAGESREELFTIPTTARGVLAVGPVSVLRGDPLGLFERVHNRERAVQLYVHPRTTGLDGLSLGHLRDLEGLPASDLSPDDVSFHALREYQPGDDRRHVHWRSSARTGTLMVRQYEETRRSHFVVGLSVRPGDYRDADEFELAISVAGSVGLRAFRDSRRLDAWVQGRALPAASGRRFLDVLAGLEQGRTRTGGLVELAGVIAAGASTASVAVLVCGSGVPAAQLRAACARLPREVRVVVVIAESGARPGLRRIGDADVVTVGALDDLPASLRKVLG